MNLLRFQVVNFNRSGVVSLNRSRVFSFTGFCNIYPLDASGFNRGNIRVLKDDFDMYHDVFEAKMNEKEY